MAKGDFIAFMDDDDFSYPYRLEQQMELFIENPDVDVLIAPVCLTTKEGHETLSFSRGVKLHETIKFI